MRLMICLLLFAISPARLAAHDSGTYERFFTAETMRVDYFHTGGPRGETVSLDRVVGDGPWPGSRTRLEDEINLGKYRYEVADLATGKLLFSQTFDSIYGEWETTAEFRSTNRTFHESLRFPWPKQPVQVTLRTRGEANGFRELWTTVIDPDSRFVNKARSSGIGRVWTIFENGPASQKLDLVILGDGYTTAETDKFHRDARRLVDKLFATEPFKSRRKDFNVRAVDTPAAESGVNRPQVGQFRRTPISAEYNIFDSERYVLTYDNRSLRDIASLAPYEFMEILVNEKHYGGGGIYNFQATTAVDTAFAEYVFVHEFGHHIAGLGDEYYVSPVAYETGAAEKPEPLAPNITALHDPARLKWRDLVEPGTPIPTPWEKEAYEKHARAIQERRARLRAERAPESAMDALFREQQAFETKLLSSMKYSGKVGAFEGAGYEAQGLYRPEADCIMFTRNEVGFCRVCSRAIERVIDHYSRP